MAMMSASIRLQKALVPLRSGIVFCTYSSDGVAAATVGVAVDVDVGAGVVLRGEVDAFGCAAEAAAGFAEADALLLLAFVSRELVNDG